MPVNVRRADLHQHFWPEGLLSSLARRTAPPRLRRGDGGWWLELADAPPERLRDADFDPALRTGFDRIVIAASLPLGIEAVPVAEGEPLLEAFHAGVLAAGFELWSSLPLADPSAQRLEPRAVGLCLPAHALASRAGLERCGPVLAALDGPLLVHPGPAPGGGWWPALTAYVAEMSAAWHAWAAWGRPAHPSLRVIFAMLAGLAPLHGERLAARGGPAGAVHDPLTAFDTSSYGVRALDAVLRVVGVDRLVYGSDRPVIEPYGVGGLGLAAEQAIVCANPERFLAAGALA